MSALFAMVRDAAEIHCSLSFSFEKDVSKKTVPISNQEFGKQAKTVHKVNSFFKFLTCSIF